MNEQFKKEVPPLEFSRLGYGRRRTISPISPSPDRRLSKYPHAHKSERINDTDPPKSIVRSNSEADVGHMWHYNRNRNVERTSRLSHNSASPSVSRRYLGRNSASPRISRRKAVEKARDDITNQLKLQSSRESSRMRPPLR